MLLIGCMPSESPEPPPPPPMPPVSAPTQCDATPAQRYIGQKASAETGAGIQTATGSSIFQWVPEGSAVTMDYRPERVRVEYQSDLTIIGITCG